MPVTAKLSRRFYEQFGDELTNELVEWFNSVDATYQSGLRELNETNFARFDARLEQRISALDARISGLDGKLSSRIDALSSRIDAMEERMDQRLTARLSSFESRMMRWMVTFWTTTMLAMVGLLVAVLRTK